MITQSIIYYLNKEKRKNKMTTLEIGGVDCRTLAKTCGTPLFIYDEEKLERQLRQAVNRFSSSQFETEVIYAAKAFSCKAMFEKVKEAGASIDVVSGGELYCAKAAGMDMSKVYFHGNNKSQEELEMALDIGCKTVVLDNMMECETLARLAEQKAKKIETLLRINPGVEAHTHEYIMTANPNSKFGISIGKRKDILSVINRIKESPYVRFRGFHCHIGSQITECYAFEKTMSIMLDFINEIQRSHSINDLSIGGGFGIKYLAGDKPIPLGEIAARLAGTCERLLKEKKMSIRKLMIEPGRSIAGEAGYSLYTVGYSKDTAGRHYIFVDGGMSDNIRPALYQAEYDCDLVNKMDQAKTVATCVAGKNCESGDILIREAMLPEAEQGDLLVVYSTGAYGYAMASNYNRAGRPAVVFAKGGKARLVLKRETYEDQLRLETNEQLA
jgi:diaminopimelate decarboxylase